MSLDSEIRRLLDLMPASGRMFTKIVSKPQQNKVIHVDFPYPWQRGTRPIYINFDLWRRLSIGQRDLLLLRTVSFLLSIKWFKADIYQGVAFLGVVGSVFELTQGDAVGVIVAGGLGAIAATQVWRNNLSPQREIEADESALQVAQRRGYRETQAAEYLLEAVEVVPQLEGRPSLTFTELIRQQNLKAKANLSSVGVPERVRKGG